MLAGLATRLAPADGLAAIAAAPSARAALTAMIAGLAADYPRLRPVARLLEDNAQTGWQEARLAACRRIAERLRDEGALSRHLSLDAAGDLLWSLTGLAMWDELVTGRGWTADRYRSHLAYLAVSALTK